MAIERKKRNVILKGRRDIDMVDKLLGILVNQMEKKEIIEKEWKEYYFYALVVMVEQWITIVSIVMISLVFRNTIPTIIFLISFFALRKRTGGFHAEKFWQCYIATILTYISIGFIADELSNHKYIVYACVIAAAFVIASIGTVNHPNMAMNKEELRESKKAARYILALECILLCVAIMLNVSMICITYMAVAVILCAILLCTAKLIKQEV